MSDEDMYEGIGDHHDDPMINDDEALAEGDEVIF